MAEGAGENGQGQPKPKSPAEDAFDWLMKNGPAWARIPAILTALIVGISSPAFLIYDKIIHPSAMSSSGTDLKTSAPDPAATKQLQMGATGQGSSDLDRIDSALNSKEPIGPEARAKLQADLRKVKHEMKHLASAEDAVPWRIFDRQSNKDYFGVKVYPSDKCILLARIENGQSSAEWLNDPNHPNPTEISSPEASPNHSQNTFPSQPLAPQPAQSLRPTSQSGMLFTPAKYTLANLEGTTQQIGTADNLEKTQMQGTCLNPHPGQWSGGWGAPINQCQTPFFRRWNDGCSHVQVFDHCANVWGPVVWQSCAAFHHE
jgi:hypothetical protein